MSYLPHEPDTEIDEMGTWLSIGDLMSALLMIFSLILLIALFQIKGFAEKVESSRLIVVHTLQESLLETSVDIAIDPTSGDISVLDSVLFDSGSANLTDAGRAFLNEFIPLYGYIVFTDPVISEEIKHVIIEGHTSSEGSDRRNLTLSLDRANAVAQYITSLDFPGKALFEERMLVSGRGEKDADQTQRLASDRRVTFRFEFANIRILDLLRLSQSGTKSVESD